MTLNTIELMPQDYSHAAILLAESFYDNPSHIYIFPDSSTRLKHLQWGLKANLQLNLNSAKYIGKSFALVEANQPPGMREIQAMAFWNYPESRSLGFVSKLKSGWLTMPFRFGVDTYHRLMEVINNMDEIKQTVLGENKAWCLNNMAVTKKLRGTGIGTKLLHQQIQTVILPSNFPAILMTQKEINVNFYQKIGFKVVQESKIGTGKSAFTNWCLLLTQS